MGWSTFWGPANPGISATVPRVIMCTVGAVRPMACSTLQSPSSGRGGKCTITACSLFSRWKKHQEQRLRSKLLYQQVERQSAVKHQQVTVREQHPQAVDPL